MTHLVVGQDGKVELAFCRLDVTGPYQEDKGVTEWQGGGVALCCGEQRLVTGEAVTVAERLLDCHPALDYISKSEGLQDLRCSAGVIGHLHTRHTRHSMMSPHQLPLCVRLIQLCLCVVMVSYYAKYMTT